MVSCVNIIQMKNFQDILSQLWWKKNFSGAGIRVALGSDRVKRQSQAPRKHLQTHLDSLS